MTGWTWRRHVNTIDGAIEHYGNFGSYSATVTHSVTGWQATVSTLTRTWFGPYYASPASAKRYAERQFPAVSVGGAA